MQRTSFLMLTATLLAGAMTLQAQRRNATSISSVAGCYALKPGPWSSPIAWAGFTLPPVFRFDTVFRSKGHQTAGDTTSWYVLRPKLPQPPASAGSPTWGFIAPDSIKIFWYPGRSGDILLLGVRGDSLRGTVTAKGDAGNGGKPAPTAQVTGVRTVCPADLR